MRKLALVTLALIMTSFVPTRNFSQILPDRRAAQAAADQWKVVLDSGAWDHAWDATGATFKSMITREYWRGLMAGRAASGDVIRSRVRSNSVVSLPGFPDGQYIVFRYQTEFRDRSQGTDIVAVRLEAASWRVASYTFVPGTTPVGVQPLTERE